MGKNLVLTLLLSTMVSCEESKNTQESTGSLSDVVDDEGQNITDFMKLIEGRYAHFDVVAYYEEVEPIGEFKTLIITYGYTDYEIIDGQLITTDRFCRSAQRSNQPFESIVSDAFTQAIIPESTAMEIRLIENEWVLWRPETPTFIGIDIEDPHESLPTDPADPRQSDDDGDGNPGVTVKMILYGEIEAELYLARREIFSYEVRRKKDGILEGQVHDRSEQLILGASLEMLESQRSPAQYPDLSKSPIILKPIDFSYDCNKIIEELDQLFPPISENWLHE